MNTATISAMRRASLNVTLDGRVTCAMYLFVRKVVTHYKDTVNVRGSVAVS